MWTLVIVTGFRVSDLEGVEVFFQALVAPEPKHFVEDGPKP